MFRDVSIYGNDNNMPQDIPTYIIIVYAVIHYCYYALLWHVLYILVKDQMKLVLVNISYLAGKTN